MRTRRSGFSLIELMVVVAILSILAALAVPAFVGYVRRSKSSEASANLNAIFKSAAAHYAKEITTNAGPDGQLTTGCIAPSSTHYDPREIGSAKHSFEGTDEVWRVLGFHIADYVYYSYAVVSVTSDPGGFCYNSATDIPDVYTFIAQGDLDDDGVMSTFEMYTGVDRDGQLYHGRGLYIADEIE